MYKARAVKTKRWVIGVYDEIDDTPVIWENGKPIMIIPESLVEINEEQKGDSV